MVHIEYSKMVCTAECVMAFYTKMTTDSVLHFDLSGLCFDLTLGNKE